MDQVVVEIDDFEQGQSDDTECEQDGDADDNIPETEGGDADSGKSQGHICACSVSFSESFMISGGNDAHERDEQDAQGSAESPVRGRV